MQVVTEKLELPPLTLQNPDGKRLMTVDIGTTTIAMQLYDMTGKVVDSFPSVNPQVSYGADVLSWKKECSVFPKSCSRRRLCRWSLRQIPP